ncbi:STAS domain-containing protein [Actinophytocola sp.]|uniref:STAS domain-containing protein n=1 Tax=Actinophytocola sp. TaxID=1872138 RepID=UPI00389A36B8
MTEAGYTLTVTPGDVDDAPAVVAVTGEIDITNASDFAGSVEEIPSTRPTILDFSDVRYLDSAGFAALSDILAARKAAIVIPVSSPVRRAAALMSLPHHATVDAARDALA